MDLYDVPAPGRFLLDWCREKVRGDCDLVHCQADHGLHTVVVLPVPHGPQRHSLEQDPEDDFHLQGFFWDCPWVAFYG